MSFDRTELIALAALLVLLTALVFFVLARWLSRFRGTRGRNRGLAAEVRAERTLKSAGYRILSHQVNGEAHVIIDGRRQAIPIRADFLVEKDGRKLVVEVKSGQRRSATIDTTRRQILEYSLAFDTRAVLLVDADAGEIHTITFDY